MKLDLCWNFHSLGYIFKSFHPKYNLSKIAFSVNLTKALCNNSLCSVVLYFEFYSYADLNSLIFEDKPDLI